jgi:hypothetical protein
MFDFTQQILNIEKEIRETPYHKGTEHHIGKLRARLARLKDKEIEAEIKKGGGGGGYALKKHGDATVVLIGPPSVGKSTLINQLTNAESKVAEYAFTTINVIPGMLFYKDAYIQIFDVPGIIAGAKQGKGRGREVLAVARVADLLIIMCDINTRGRFPLIENELFAAGIRINQKPPEISVVKKTEGGIEINSNLKQDLVKETIVEIAKEMGLKNAKVNLKEKVTAESLIDAFSSNRVYLPALYVINKIDAGKIGQKYDDLYLPISATSGAGLEDLKEKIWEKLKLLRVFLVRPADVPSFNNPVIAKDNQTLKEVAEEIGENFAQNKKAAKIWGTKARFAGQEVSLSTPVAENMQIKFV